MLAAKGDRPAVIWNLLPTLALLLIPVPAPADVPTESTGRVLELPREPGPHWVWIADVLLRRTALLDADDGALLGMVSAGNGIIAPNFPSDHRELYMPGTFYARATRGERTDVVTVYDAASLLPIDEVVIPPKRAEHLSGVAASALSDDDRFLAVFNLNPASSLSIVDVQARRFVGEISTPGCALVYPAGPRRFAMLCGDGSLLTLTLDDAGTEAGRERSQPFFDPNLDPVTEKAARAGDAWLFVSFEGWVHPVDVGGPTPRFEERWSLVDEADRARRWRVGGMQHLAVHQASDRLYALMHQGGPDTHKDPGTEVWVYDLDRRERVRRIPVRNPSGVFLLQLLELQRDGVAARTVDWLLQRLLPHAGADRIQVTQDEQPVLLTSSAFPATLSVYDAETGEFLRDLREVGFAGSMLQAP
jgi:methylamine dehydrogenase heavy chain